MQKETIKEIAIYSLVAASSLVLTAYVVHMFVDGLVEDETKFLITVGAVCLVATAIGFMVWDVVKRRRSSGDY